MISISSCYSAADRSLFERIPEMLHGREPGFVPPFPGSIAKFLKPDSLFNRQDGSITAFIARREGRPVGRNPQSVAQFLLGRPGWLLWFLRL